MSEFATYRHHRRGSPRKSSGGDVTPKIGAGTERKNLPRSPPIVAPHLRNSVDLFDHTQAYGSEKSLIAAPCGHRIPVSPLRTSQSVNGTSNAVEGELEQEGRKRREQMEFQVRSGDVLDVLTELKGIEEMVDQLQNLKIAVDTSGNDLLVRRKSSESFSVWVEQQHFGDVCLCTPESYRSMKTFVADAISSWFEEECRRVRSDTLITKTLREAVAHELRRISYTAARIRAHFSRLPKDVQMHLKNGHIDSFEHIYDYIASAHPL